MKYHYQYVSPKSVRIELIAEDRKETEQLDKFNISGADDQELKSFYITALTFYTTDSNISKINFMKFPRVALLSFEPLTAMEKAQAI